MNCARKIIFNIFEKEYVVSLILPKLGVWAKFYFVYIQFVRHFKQNPKTKEIELDK